jgi:peptidyl-prolyl cis-trans isomerase SurA
MSVKHLLFSYLFFSISLSWSQNSSKDVLFTIDQKPYFTDEFIRVYNKNLDLVKDESQKDLNQYLELFVGYKLKVNKAYKLNLQDDEQYKNELKSYRSQLAKNYFNDTKITQELVNEGYERLQKEIKASHILIMCEDNATPEDTLKAYTKAKDIRNRILSGEDFGTLASTLSEDPSAKENKGNLGYFSAFRMVYAFENAAFNTPKGEISKIIRTRFGYHILKVEDVRANRGEVTVAHIMILNPKPEDADQDKPKNTINDIYKKLLQGEKFEDLAKQFSDDKSSSSKGGVIMKFSSGQLSSEEFENASFSLKNVNDISAPFQSAFGWHIVKLIQKHPLKSIDEMKSELETKIERDDRSKKIQSFLKEKLRKKYTLKKDPKVYAAIEKTVTNDYYESKWTMPTTDFSSILLTIDNTKKIEGKAFVEYLDRQQKAGLTVKPINKLVGQEYEKFIDQELNTYYDSNLEKEFTDFANIMEEYRDGLLLFSLMEKEIWERSKSDTIGLQNFYETQKSKHLWKKRVVVTIFSSTKMDVMKKAKSMLVKGKSEKDIKDKLNTKDLVNIMATNGTFEEGAEQLPKSLQMETGVSDITKEGEYYFVTKVDKVLPEGYKTLEECKGKVINDYQQFLEQNWVENLKKEFTISINNEVFEKIKKQLNH